MRTRWLLAALSIFISVRLMMIGLKIAGIGSAFPVIFSMATFLLAVILISPETAFRLAEWCSKPLTDLIFPSEEFKKPPLSYMMARHYTQGLRFEEAAAEYEKIIHYYPKEQDAYLELLAVAKKLKDDKLLHKYEHMFKHRFHREAALKGEPSSE